MNTILKLFPLPLDVVDIIMSYAIQKIPKTDIRYDLLLTIPKKYSSCTENSFVFLPSSSLSCNSQSEFQDNDTSQICNNNNKFVLFVFISANNVLYTFNNFNDNLQIYKLL